MHKIKNNFLKILIFLVLILILGFFLRERFLKDEFKLPKGGKSQEITITQNGPTKKIMVTNGVKHSLPLEEIVGGGPPKDGIPSIDHPKFISVSEAQKWLKDDEPGVAYTEGKVDRFYPQ